MADELTPQTARMREGKASKRVSEVRRSSHGDAWLIWLLSLGAIAVPVVILLTIDSLKHDAWRTEDVRHAFYRGDFLVPVLIIGADTIRRWWREVSCGGFLALIRLIATFICTTMCIACFAGTVVSVIASSRLTEVGIAQLTIAGLVIAIIFGTVAVGLPGREAARE